MSLNYYADYYFEKTRHAANYAASWTGGMALRLITNILGHGGAASLGLKAATGKATLLAGAAGLASVGVSTGVSAYLNYKEYQYEQRQLMNLYRGEIAAKLGKDKSLVTVDDLKSLAEINPTLDEELKRSRRKMRVQTGVDLLSTFSSYGAVVGVFSFFAASITAVTLPMLFAGFAVAVLTHYVAEKILEPVSHKLFNIHERTPIDRIRTMEMDQQRGRKISQEQVLAVYVAASPDLQNMIKKDFGQSFDNLSLIKQHEAAVRYGPTLGLQQVTDAINENRLSARELTFRIHGDTSGAYPEPTMHQQVQQKLSILKQSISNGREAANAKWNNFTSAVSEKSQGIVNSGKNWVQSLGLKPSAAKAEGQGWQEQIKAERETSVATPPAPILH